jgi:hypothetical protein
MSEELKTLRYETYKLIHSLWNQQELHISAGELLLYLTGNFGIEGLALLYVNLLKTKHNLLYIRNQSEPHTKLFPPWL